MREGGDNVGFGEVQAETRKPREGSDNGKSEKDLREVGSGDGEIVCEGESTG